MGKRPAVAAFAVVVVLSAAAVLFNRWRTHQTEAELLRLPADNVATNASLVAFATERGPSLYADHCAQCHGADLRGDIKRGAPNLRDAVWMFGSGAISDIEATIQYGVRSGHPKAHNITDMPAFLRIGQLSEAEIDDVVEYVLSLSGQPHDAGAAQRGYDLYANKGNCFDCHSSDALGNPDYGAPALTGPVWVYGGTREQLRQSVREGRHGLCPAWALKLSPASVRELAVYLHGLSERAAASAPQT
jgi:cytochrome c oxidase cbb3-type subunit 3